MRQLLDEWEGLADRGEEWRTSEDDPFVAITAGISSLSEDFFFAGWLIGCEWDLLAIVETGEPTPTWPIAAQDIAAFRAHRDRASGGWVMWRDHGHGLGIADYAAWGPYSLTADELATQRRT